MGEKLPSSKSLHSQSIVMDPVRYPSQKLRSREFSSTRAFLEIEADPSLAQQRVTFIMPFDKKRILAFIDDEDENLFGLNLEKELSDSTFRFSILSEFEFDLTLKDDGTIVGIYASCDDWDKL